MIPAKSPSVLLRLVIAVFFFGIGCDSQSPVDPDPDSPPIEEPGTIVYAVRTGDNLFYVVRAPFETPVDAVKISPEDSSYSEPRISADGSRAVYRRRNGFYSNQPYITEFETGNSFRVVANSATARQSSFPTMETIVWTSVSDGYFFTERADAPLTRFLWLYSFTDSSKIQLSTEFWELSTMIGTDTLLVRNMLDPGDYRGFRLLDLSGTEIGEVPLDTLSGYIPAAIDGRAFNASWNPVRRVLAYEIFRADRPGSVIAISELNGQNFKIVSDHSGISRNVRPRWGPNGILIFERTIFSDSFFEMASLMAFDVDTGKTSVYLAPNMIPGALGITYFDYARAPN